ncbi:MAG TPA: hypothetical protein VMM76_14290 [Pirellulaceae bacterium]|nr:hypothetical protein [Pirellulaceae bacterium]
MSEFVAEQRRNLGTWQTGSLKTPTEGVYVPGEQTIAKIVGIDGLG